MNTLMMSVMDLECSTFAMCACIFVSRICELGEECQDCSYINPLIIRLLAMGHITVKMPTVTIVSCVLKFME